MADPRSYDIIVIGGGIAGAAFGGAMASHGADVLVLERTLRFTDRIRGEWIAPWGVAELQNLGLYDVLVDGCGYALPGFTTYIGGRASERRDLPATTPQQIGAVTFFHPAMQSALLAAAAAAGARVQRGARVGRIERAGDGVVVDARIGAGVERCSGRLVVIADGRESTTRAQAGFELEYGSLQRSGAGLMYRNAALDHSSAHVWINPSNGCVAYFFPRGPDIGRGYVLIGAGSAAPRSPARFARASLLAGMPRDVYAGAEPVGLLATVAVRNRWVERPYRDRVALVGAAAGASDPTWGQGMSITLRDVRVLWDLLADGDDWDEAGRAYAEERARYFGTVLTFEGWMDEMLTGTGPDADARRGRAMPLWAEDRDRVPDIVISGPDGAILDERARRRYFGEE